MILTHKAQRGRRDESNQETAKRGAGELAMQGLQVGRPLPWTPLVRRVEDCPPYLLVPARRAERLSNVIRSLRNRLSAIGSYRSR